MSIPSPFERSRGNIMIDVIKQMKEKEKRKQHAYITIVKVSNVMG